MKLVVGLGNPGKQYERTRHNVGFDVIAELARRFDAGRPKAKFNAEYAEVFVAGEKTILMCPLTFMNLSGRSVGDAVDFFKIETDDLLVVCDDLSLPIARLRMKTSGSAGGQNGLKDIIQRIGTQKFPRLRIGIDRPPAGHDTSGYVLGKFNDEQASAIKTGIVRAADAAECWIRDGADKAMSRFNPDPEEIKKRAERKRLADERREEKRREEKRREEKRREEKLRLANLENEKQQGQALENAGSEAESPVESTGHLDSRIESVQNDSENHES